MASDDIPDNARWLLYFTWHNGTVALPLCAGALALAALKPGRSSATILATLILLGFGVQGLAIATFGDGVLWGTPAPYAFGIIGLIAMAGVLTDRSAL